MKSSETYTLDEILVLSNDELKSNWSKLATLVRAYEKGTWDEAAKKARELLKEKSADLYIDSVRAYPNGKPADEPDQKVAESGKKASEANSIYHRNYKLLLKVAPGLDEILENPKKEKDLPDHGKSESSVFMDLHLDIIFRERGGKYHIALSHYYKENGDMVPDPDMRLLVDVKNETVEATEFQNSMIYSRVYDDSFGRKMVNPKEKNSQNKFLSTWLRNLVDQDHEIVWDEPEKEPESVIVDEYAKTKGNDADKSSKEKAMKKDEEKQEPATKRKRVEPEKQLEKHKVDGLQKSNYQKLMRVLPGIFDQLTKIEDAVRLSCNDTSLPVYEITRMGDKNNMVRKYSVYEDVGGQNKIGVLVIGVMTIRKLLIPLDTINSFFTMAFYDESIHAKDPKEKYRVNKGAEKWLDFMIEKKYEVETKKTPVIEMKPEKQKQSEPTPKKDTRKQPEDQAPDFEVGQVRLLDVHKRHGLTQKHINWINKHKQGMVITPRKKRPINNTIDLLMDQAIQAKRPGCRVSATGKIYYEGRSNRSDLTDAGL